MITFTDEQAIAIFDAVSDDETYTPIAIFSQVWEAPYSWFRLTGGPSDILPNTVAEINEGSWTIASHKLITEDMIKAAAIRSYFSVGHKPTDKWRRSLYSYLMDLDANDVDAILQFAMFGEIIYC